MILSIDPSSEGLIHKLGSERWLQDCVGQIDSPSLQTGVTHLLLRNGSFRPELLFLPSLASMKEREIPGTVTLNLNMCCDVKRLQQFIKDLLLWGTSYR